MKLLSFILNIAGYLSVISMAGAGCVSQEDSLPPPIQQEQVAPALAESKTDTVKISAMAFVPDVITVATGTTVVFINNDMVSHDVTEEASQAWSSNILAPSKMWSMTVDKSTNYYCSIHVVMKGKIIVR